MISYKLEGLEEATRMLAGVSDKMHHKILVKVMRAAGAPIAKAARANVRKSSGRIARSIKVWDFKKSSFPNAFVGPRYTKDPQKDPWFAHMIEGGTKGVKKNNVRRAKGLQSDPDNIRIRSIVKHTRSGSAYRNDQPANPFMANAVRDNQAKSVSILTNDITQIIEKELQKQAR